MAAILCVVQAESPGLVKLSCSSGTSSPLVHRRTEFDSRLSDLVYQAERKPNFLEMMVDSLLLFSTSSCTHLLWRVLNKEDMAGDLPRWLEAVQADTPDAGRMLCKLMDSALFKPLLAISWVTAGDVMAGGKTASSSRPPSSCPRPWLL